MWMRNRSAGRGALPYLLLAAVAFLVIANAPSASAHGKGAYGCNHGKGLWGKGRCGGSVVVVQPVHKGYWNSGRKMLQRREVVDLDFGNTVVRVGTNGRDWDTVVRAGDVTAGGVISSTRVAGGAVTSQVRAGGIVTRDRVAGGARTAEGIFGGAFSTRNGLRARVETSMGRLRVGGGK